MSRNELWGQSAQYFAVKGFAAAVGLLGFAIYTRLLTAEQYGHYSLIITAVGLVNLIVFNALKLGLLRFFPANRENPSPLLSTVAGLFLAFALAVGIAAAVTAAVWPGLPLRSFLAVSGFLLLAQAWMEANLEIARAELNPGKFGVITAVRAVVGVAFAAALAKAGYGAYGVLAGLAIGFLVPSLVLFKRIWGCVRVTNFRRPVMREMLAYGIPLSLTASLAFILAGSDRFMIMALIGDGPVGLYSSAYDLGHHGLSMICMTVGLAGTPLAINALENGGWEAAKQQYMRNGNLLLALAVPSAFGLIVTGPLLIDLVLGAEFRSGAASIFPWVVLGVLFQSLKFYYLDTAFYLHKATRIQVWIVLPAAALNIVMNYFLLPRVGIIGAAWSTAACYFLAAVVTVVYAQVRLRMPVPWNQAGRVLLAGLLMVVGLLVCGRLGGRQLAVQIPLGILLYISASWLLGVTDIRGMVGGLVGRIRGRGV